MGGGSGRPPTEDEHGAVSRLEAELQSLRVLYETAPDPLLTVDRGGVVRRCNQTAVSWFSSTRAELVGQPLAPWFSENSQHQLDELITTDWVGSGERRLALRDGRHILVKGRRLGDGRFHLALRDITALQVLDEEDARQRSNRAMTELAGAIARDLNDPISVVQGRVEYLIEIGEEDPDEIRRHLGVALDHARRVATTLRNLRLVGHTPPGRLDAVRVDTVLAEAVQIGGTALRQVQVELDLEPADLEIGGQQALYARLFANLLTRAAEAMRRHGTVRVSGRLHGEDVLLAVEDDGPALPKGELSDLWSLDREEARFFNLGLSIAHTIAGSMGGGLVVRRRGSTTSIEVRLPRPADARGRSRAAAECLLVVGGEELADAVGALAGREGYSLKHVERGGEALTTLSDGGIDVVVCELRLADMSGLALAGALLERHPELTERVLVATNARIHNLPAAVRLLPLPLRRVELLQALGRRVRPRRS